MKISIAIISILISINSQAQVVENFKPYYYMNLGIGISLKSVIADQFFGAPTKSSPVYDASIQYKNSETTAMGACFAYQSFVTEDIANSKFGATSTILSKFFNPGIFFSYSYNLNKNINLYFQPKLNYQIQRTDYIFKYPAFNINSKVNIPIKNANSFNFQFASGFNLFFSQILGINFEGAIGSPYFIRVGAICKFTNNTTNTNRIPHKAKPQDIDIHKKKSIYN